MTKFCNYVVAFRSNDSDDMNAPLRCELALFRDAFDNDFVDWVDVIFRGLGVNGNFH